MNKVIENHHYLIGDDFLMKKIIVTVVILIFLFKTVSAQDFNIPKDAIRIRIIANSNSEYDQSIKMKLKNLLQQKLYTLLKDINGTKNARKLINTNLEEIDKNVKNLLDKENYNLGYKIKFGQNYFNKKIYKGITYKEGYYESLLVTLGKGEGDNWWCVLFPPLCLIEAEESDKVEYKFFVQELIEKYL